MILIEILKILVSKFVERTRTKDNKFNIITLEVRVISNI